MKKILIVFSVLFLCCTTCFAQSNYEVQNGESYTKFWVALSLIGFALIITWLVLIVLFVFFSKGYIIKVTVSSKRVEEKFVLRKYFASRIYDIDNIKKELLKDDKIIKSIAVEVLEGHKCLALSNNEKRQSNQEQNIVKSDIKFFKTKNGKVLTEELPNSTDASFKVFNIKYRNNEPKGGYFEYCGGIVNTDFFNEICTFENNPENVPNKTKIITIKRGRVLIKNGKWEITEKSIIKFK